MSRKAIHDLADTVEDALIDEGLQLTMGGEPTFIPLNAEGAEWNNAAMGPQKLGYARRLARSFLEHNYNGGLVMQIFGKQYPNEPLPRWVMLTLKRKDGQALWHAPRRLLLDDKKGAHKPGAAGKLIRAIAKRLCFTGTLYPAYETDKKSTRGWVLPLDYEDGKWISDCWPFNKDKPLTLFPGDSHIGLRLPLWELGEKGLRRALTVEVMDGALMIFIPPLIWEGFQSLIGIIEACVEQSDINDVVFCGYKPYETGGAIEEIGAAADPGVLEINLPPAQTWREYDRVLNEVEHAAKAEHLQTLKLNLNGQIQGSGGGAHLIFGGPSVEANPFLQRPSLLAGVIRYWQHHPSLAYFFTGQYVGPGSQAPRADETLMAKLYELDLACSGLENATECDDKGFIDRLLRNLMTDSGGNTHRVEICLDKFWNMDSTALTARLGLVELRAFETYQKVELQSLAALLMRTIMARLAKHTFSSPLRNFGNELHDRFMLPHVLWEDLQKICEDLKSHGLPFEAGWLRPVFEFRFPVLGEFKIGKSKLTFRQALEPWPLMAEVADAGFTSRVVDNSTDRIEVSTTDAEWLKSGVLAINGVEPKFQKTGGVYVAGIRYKCANGWPALHPHIPVHSPLQITWTDKTSNTVQKAAEYYYWNPDAPVYDGRPKTVAEAQKRQKARWRTRRLPKDETIKTRKAVYSEAMQFTLDLRNQPLGNSK